MDLMLLGFISLLLTVGQTYIVKICIPAKMGSSMLPCMKEGKEYHGKEDDDDDGGDDRRKLLWFDDGAVWRRALAAPSDAETHERLT
ncbi:hypothetical protein ACLOJK_038546 [Asimina triloba]